MPAINNPRLLREIEAGTTSMMVPRYITAIRSANAKTSSSSVLNKSTARPASRSCTIFRERIQSSQHLSRELVVKQQQLSPDASSRANTTFCLLPPESDETSSLAPWLRISNSAMRFSAWLFIILGLIIGPLAFGAKS